MRVLEVSAMAVKVWQTKVHHNEPNSTYIHQIDAVEIVACKTGVL